MLCGNHFDDSSFTSSGKKELNKLDVPKQAQNVLAELQDDHISPLKPPKTNKMQRRKFHLKKLDTKTKMALTPKKIKLYYRCKINISKIISHQKTLQGLNLSEKSIFRTLISEDSVNDLIKFKLPAPFCLLLQSQLCNVPPVIDQEFSLDDKILALSIYKKSSACYRLLRRFISLPNQSSLNVLLNKVPLLCGINKQVLQRIKQITKKRSKNENLCILAFDEMSMRKHLSYNPKLDQINGYQDHGFQGRTSEIANHALVFMAIGLHTQWKQPIAFYFSSDKVTAETFAVLIKEVLQGCFDAGLEVMGTICDLDSVNIHALNFLGSSKDQPFINFEGREIITMLDPPHLLKCFRNDFLKHDIEFTLYLQKEVLQGIAKWSHIEEFYKIDHLSKPFVFAEALRHHHVKPNRKQKNIVCVAAVALSHKVAGGIIARIASKELPQEAMGTAMVISHMDKLLDALNDDTTKIKTGKHKHTKMSSSSPHLDFFIKMRAFFTELKFLGATNKPPSQDGWLWTLNAIERLFGNLKKRKVSTLSLRRLNQDPLKSCFRCIRSYSAKPTSVQFIGALKTSILTNLIIDNNNEKMDRTEDDDNDLLCNFKVFLTKGKQVIEERNIKHKIETSIEDLKYDIPQCSGEMEACAYVCKFIVKKMANCQQCKKIMLVDPTAEVNNHLFTPFKEYNDVKCSLENIQASFCETVENATNLVNNYLKENSHNDKIKCNLFNLCINNLNIDWLKGCEKHYDVNLKKILDVTIVVCLKSFCIVENRGFYNKQ